MFKNPNVNLKTVMLKAVLVLLPTPLKKKAGFIVRAKVDNASKFNCKLRHVIFTFIKKQLKQVYNYKL